MTAVSQLVPNYILGISDQPDELKRPGQVRESVNTYPDITFGLSKRPGSEYLNELKPDDEIGDGKWFSYFRSNAAFAGGLEKYIVYVSKSGDIQIWNAVDGKEQIVEYQQSWDETKDPKPQFGSDPFSKATNTTTNYLKHNKPEEIQALTISDFTFLCNRETKVKFADKPPAGAVVYEAFVDIRTLAYGRNYTFQIKTPLPSGSVPVVITGTTTVTDAGVDINKEYDATSSGVRSYKGDNTFTFSPGGTPDKKDLELYFDTTFTKKTVITGVLTTTNVVSTSTVIINGGQNFAKGDVLTANGTLKKDTDGTEADQTVTYEFTVTGVENKAENIISEPAVKTPNTGATTVTVANILNGLKQDINKEAPALFVDIIGNGLYISSPNPFSIETSEPDLFNILAPAKTVSSTDPIPFASCIDISDLPSQCKNGFIANVENTADDADDYYVIFEGDLGIDGTGVWVETVKPGLYNEFDRGTMPYQLFRSDKPANSQGQFTFRVSQVDWDDRDAGDVVNNPAPTFAPDKGHEDPSVADNEKHWKKINNMIFFRNRFCFLSDENIIMSRPGQLFNFWNVSAISVSPKDPIDTSATTTYASKLMDSIPINNGLVLFSEFQQFLLTTDSDLLTNDTVKITPVGSYEFNPKTSPFRMGNTFGFLATGDNHSMFYEMADVFREGEPVVVESSTIVKKRFLPDLTEISSSREQGLIGFSKRDSTDMFIFRYFNNGTERTLASWVQWKMSNSITFHDMIADDYYFVLKDSGKFYLNVMKLRSAFVDDTANTKDFVNPIHLDYKRTTKPAFTPKTTGNSTFTIEIPVFAGKKIMAYNPNNGDVQEVKVSGTTGTLRGDWTGVKDIVYGYVFETRIEFPTPYVTSVNNNQVRSQAAKNLTIHRCNLSFGATGQFDIHLERFGMDDYTFSIEARPMNAYKATTDAVGTEVQEIIPVYCKNTRYTMSIDAENPTPLNLYSMTWEGDYNQKYYKNV